MSPSRHKRTSTSGSTPRSARSTGRPTIRDVSQLAGVSRMTVSRVIRGLDLVLPETRDRVHKAIADLGYVPDRAAGSLASRRTGFIALMLPTLTNANFSAVAHGLTEALRSSDYHLLIAYTDYSVAEEERQLRNLLARRPEAIVLTSALHSRTASRMLMAADIPVIEIADLPRQPTGHAIGFSNYEAGRTAARYLLGKGFKRVGAIASANEGDVLDHRGEERMRGFEDALRQAGRPTDLVLRHGQAPVSYEHGAAMVPLVLERGIDAVFAVSDLSAVGVVMECQRRGVRVPDDLSVMGFGDFEIGRVINPPITTIHVDFKALGQRTGQLILDLVGEERPELRSIDVGLRVIERESVRTQGGGSVDGPDGASSARRIVVMGVSGCGKSTLARALAERLGMPFIEGDALHPAANIAKMAAGIALDDADRQPFLEAVADALCSHPAGAVASCSALKRSYRDLIRARAGNVTFILPAIDRAALAARLATRQDHFMPAALLDSQLATLEPPTADEAAIHLDGLEPTAAQVDAVLAALNTEATP